MVRNFFELPWEEVKSIPMPPGLALSVAMQHMALQMIEQVRGGSLFGPRESLWKDPREWVAQ